MLTFAPLQESPWLVHGFTLRVPDLPMDAERGDAVHRIRTAHEEILQQHGVAWNRMCLAEQVHRSRVERVNTAGSDRRPATDGLVAIQPGVPLGMFVADCCAIYLVETARKAIGLLHSGKKGTQANIAEEGVRRLCEACDGEAARITAVLSPCIHGCCYDLDFVTRIEDQLRAAGVEKVWRHPDCTGCHLDRYYSYRKEKGRTGRMLAFLMIREKYTVAHQ